MNINEYLGINSRFEDEHGEKMSHEAMYDGIVQAIGLESLIPLLPESKQVLKTAYEEDEHLNNIPLKEWDMRQQHVRQRLRRIGITTSSISQTVCILKHAARLYITQ